MLWMLFKSKYLSFGIVYLVTIEINICLKLIFLEFVFMPPRIDRSGDAGAYSFWLVHLSAKTFTLATGFKMVSDRAFIFYIYIPWGKTLSFLPKSRSNIKVIVFEKMAIAGAFMFHKHILFLCSSRQAKDKDGA